MIFTQPVYEFAHALHIRNDEDCEKLIQESMVLADQVEAGDDRNREILEMMLNAIERYEDKSFRLPENATPEKVMVVLMEENGHNQSAMTDIASRTVINEIINGKRKLTRTHIERLCRKYKVSASVFYGEQ